MMLLNIVVLWSVSFEDIQYWVGEGENETLLIIDWNDNQQPESLVWGVRFATEITGIEMLTAVAEADSRLIVEGEYFLDHLTFEGHSSTDGYDFWSTWSWDEASGWNMNSGLGSDITDNMAFGCSYGFSPATEPDEPTPVEPLNNVEYPISFEEVAFWVGEGENEALLIIDWNDNQQPESLVWGVRFATEITGIEMLTAVAEADSRLIVEGEYFLEHLTFEGHSSVDGDDFWSTWSWDEASGWNMNGGLGSDITDNMAFGCSYGFSPATEPDDPTAVELPIVNNEPPIAGNDEYWLRNDLAYKLFILDNDTDDEELDISMLTIVTDPLYGYISINDSGYLLYTGEGNYEGLDIIEYSLQDVQGAVSNVATININLIAPFAAEAGTETTTAIANNSDLIKNWATGIEVVRGSQDISNPDAELASYGLAENALGEATDEATSVVSLGDGGYATLTFEKPITNGEGFDFAVFENSFSDFALELAFVEVSSDGENFVRFPAVSLTQYHTQISNSGQLDPQSLHNLAGKYRAGYGTPFDLEELRDSLAVNIDSVSFVRVVDVVGSINPEYATYDIYGNIINDPFETPFPSSGFDLNGVAVLNELTPVSNQDSAVPMLAKASLNNAYPNPFNPETTLSFSLPARMQVNLAIYNIKGQVVKTLVSASMEQGEHSIVWKGTDNRGKQVASGLYLYRLSTENSNQVRKVVLQK
ncbi:MAG: FlgD immunoglobulin-like domain containing protein [Candidatus Cloacimonadales bacterium]